MSPSTYYGGVDRSSPHPVNNSPSSSSTSAVTGYPPPPPPSSNPNIQRQLSLVHASDATSQAGSSAAAAENACFCLTTLPRTTSAVAAESSAMTAGFSSLRNNHRHVQIAQTTMAADAIGLTDASPKRNDSRFTAACGGGSDVVTSSNGDGVVTSLTVADVISGREVSNHVTRVQTATVV